MLKWILAGVFLCLLQDGAHAACQTTRTGLTWDSEDTIAEINNIQSASQCADECEKLHSSCQGYTWFTETSTCHLFKQTEKEISCHDCVNGKSFSSQTNMACALDEYNVVLTLKTNSSQECILKCSQEDDCYYATWRETTDNRDNCLMTKSCIAPEENQGSTIFKQSCLDPLPSQCHHYYILDDHSRNTLTGPIGVAYSDDWYSDSISPDWEQSGFWYRVAYPAGIKLSGTDLGERNRCGTEYPIYAPLQDYGPVGTYGNQQVYYYTGEPETPVKYYNEAFVNCGDFLVYSLRSFQVRCSGCKYRYCTE